KKLERTTETLPLGGSAAAPGRRDACLVHIYPSGPSMGRRYPLNGSPVIIGRGTDCDVQIDDNSVSPRHARSQSTNEGHLAIDLESTNGTYVNNVPAASRLLRDGDYLRVGNCIYRYLAGGNVEAEYHEEIYRLTIIDGLTEVPNKRYLLEFLDRELSRSARYNRPLPLITFAIARFKGINDELGHLGGDFTHRELAAAVKGSIRKEELFARYGGEEFVVVLPETTAESGQLVGERIRMLVERHTVQYEGKTYPV